MIPVLIIPVLNRYDLLKQSINSIDFPIGEVLVLDNGGECDEVLESSFANVRVLTLPSNLGMSASWNLGIKLYPHEKFWVFSSADILYVPGSLDKMYQSSHSGNAVLSEPAFGFFSVGEDVIRKVGLFDEGFYPIYFEDNDFSDRVKSAGLPIDSPGITVSTVSDGSQTIKSDPRLMERNHVTFLKNQERYELKKTSGDYTLLGWNIDTRRENEWMR